MILILYGFLALIALVLIVIGLSKPHESAQAIVGFVFLFFLAIVLLQGNLEVEVGAQTNTTYGYDNVDRINFTSQDISYKYEEFDDNTSRQMGIYMAIASIVGVVAVLVGLRRTRKNDWQQG